MNIKEFLKTINLSGDGYGYGSGDGDGSGDGIKSFCGDVVYYIDHIPSVIKTIKNNIAKGYILRKDMTLESKNNDSVLLANARKLFYWDGAGAVEGISIQGTTKPENCKFTVAVA